MILIGEYTQLPDWLPARAGTGILALRREPDGMYREQGVCPAKNPSYLAFGGGESFYAAEEGGQGGAGPLQKNAGGCV